MLPYSTVIFDLDGTLLDTLQDLADSVNHVLSLHQMPLRSLDEIRQFVGNGVELLICRAVPAGTAPDLEAQCLSEFRAYYAAHMSDHTAPYSGVPELLESLARAGIRVAVVSNKFDGAVKGLCRSYFGSLVPVAIGESQGVARKPAPDTVFRALAELGAEAGGAVYVGDSEVDIQTARNAGLPCLSVSWGFRDSALLTEQGAKRIFSSPGTLQAFLLGGQTDEIRPGSQKLL